MDDETLDDIADQCDPHPNLRDRRGAKRGVAGQGRTFFANNQSWRAKLRTAQAHSLAMRRKKKMVQR